MIMFYVYIILLLIAFSFAYFSASLMTVPTSMNEQISDWVSFFIMDKESFILTFLILLLIFFLLIKPSKYMFNIMFSTGNSLISWEKVKGVIVLILIINLFLYLFMIYSWYLLIPLLSFLIIKVTLHT